MERGRIIPSETDDRFWLTREDAPAGRTVREMDVSGRETVSERPLPASFHPAFAARGGLLGRPVARRRTSTASRGTPTPASPPPTSGSRP